MKLSRELAKQAVITKCRGYINAEPSRVFIKNKAVDFRAKKKICDNQNIFDIYNLWKSVIICGQKNSVDKGMLNI